LSWSFGPVTGKIAKVLEAIDDNRRTCFGQCLVEYEKAIPILKAIVLGNTTDNHKEYLVVKASGSEATQALPDGSARWLVHSSFAVSVSKEYLTILI
jgi:hypothetical protein